MKCFLATAAVAAMLSVPVVPALADSPTEVLKGDVNSNSQAPALEKETTGQAGAKAKALAPKQMQPAAIVPEKPGLTQEDKNDAKANDKGQ